MSKSKNTRTYSRPGVEASTRLAETLLHNPSAIWERIEGRYDDMLNYKGGAGLTTLDRGCVELGAKIKKVATEEESDRNLCIASDELYKVVEWKFSKGKTRHALWKHLKGNTDESVRSCSRRAFTKVRRPSTDVDDGDNNDGNDGDINEDDIVDVDGDDVKGAINELTKLKGVGPATASAVLSLYRPDLFAFMDDEVIECLYPKPRGYTLKIYLEVNLKCRGIAKRLGKGWNGRRVGRALWTASQLCASGEDDDLTLSVVNGEGGVDGEDDAGADANDVDQPVEKKPEPAAKIKKQRRNLRSSSRIKS